MLKFSDTGNRTRGYSVKASYVNPYTISDLYSSITFMLF